MARLPNWVERVNDPSANEELEAVRSSDDRGQPFGDTICVESTARRLNLSRNFDRLDDPKQLQKTN